MQLQINGAIQQLPTDTTLAELLERLALGSSRVAVELNQAVVPRSQHAATTLHAGDCVEIVHAIGGG
ncbi:MAG TPA: sulfur carrier protein ThiS [Motiliproteus sp.]